MILPMKHIFEVDFTRALREWLRLIGSVVIPGSLMTELMTRVKYGNDPTKENLVKMLYPQSE